MGCSAHLASLRENPLRSLHWWDPVEQFVQHDGEWFDLDYDACVFGGARRKAQKFRRNVLELASLPAVTCAHIHDPNEWRSSQVGQFSTFTEAKYTPSLVFTLAVCCTAWAARHGYGTGCPPIATSGDVRPLRLSWSSTWAFHPHWKMPPTYQRAWWLWMSFKTGRSSTKMTSTSALAISLIDGH